MLLFMLLCRIADLVLHGVFRLVCSGLHYDQGQVEILRRVSSDCDKVCIACVHVCAFAYAHECVCVLWCVVMSACVYMPIHICTWMLV